MRIFTDKKVENSLDKTSGVLKLLILKKVQF